MPRPEEGDMRAMTTMLLMIGCGQASNLTGAAHMAMVDPLVGIWRASGAGGGGRGLRQHRRQGHEDFRLDSEVLRTVTRSALLGLLLAALPAAAEQPEPDPDSLSSLTPDQVHEGDDSMLRFNAFFFTR